MSFHVSLDSLEDIHRCLMIELLESPDFKAAPRGKPIHELMAASFTLMDPRNRLIMSPARAANYGFGVGELCWYVRGDDDLATMTYYNKRMTQFSDDGVTINSAYGARILNGGARTDVQPSQWTLCIEELRRDPDSRRAVMHINQPRDLRKAVAFGSKDVPCTMSIQLFIRDRLLHMHVLMRSNDIVWGLPYDVFSFTCLMESFLYQLQENGVEVDGLGQYHHTAGSLHLYDTHFEMAKDVIGAGLIEVAPMKPFTLNELEWLAHTYEPLCRASCLAGGSPNISYRSDDKMPDGTCTRFVEPTTLDWMVSMLVDHRDKRVIERLKKEAP